MQYSGISREGAAVVSELPSGPVLKDSGEASPPGTGLCSMFSLLK